jgi:hypothetical protein
MTDGAQPDDAGMDEKTCFTCWLTQRRGRPGHAAEFCAAIADDEPRVIELTPYDLPADG